MSGTLVLAVLASSSASSLAQNPKDLQMPAMTAQHRQMAALVGDWKISGVTHKGCPYGEGKFTAREHTELMPGGMFLVTRTQYSSLFKNSNQIAIVGVDPATKQYTYNMYSNTGVTVQAMGAPQSAAKASLVGNAIQWKMGTTNAHMAKAGQAMVYTTQLISPTRYKFSLVVGGGSWYEGIADKVEQVVNPAK
jgi:hypothetical protein